MEYLAEPPEEALVRIADAQWDKDNAAKYGVVFLDIHQHNACNHTLSGTIDVDGVVHGFIIESGDWNGTVVHGWGDPEDVGCYLPGEPPEPRTFVPTNRFLFTERPEMFRVYAYWRTQEWFRDMERSYNYDRHFQPGGQVETYYKEKAAKRGLVPGFLSNFTADERAVIDEVAGRH